MSATYRTHADPVVEIVRSYKKTKARSFKREQQREWKHLAEVILSSRESE